MSSEQDGKVIVSVIVQGDPSLTGNVELREVRAPDSVDNGGDWPDVRILTPSPNHAARSGTPARSQSLGRTRPGDPWTAYGRRREPSSGPLGRSRVFAASDDAAIHRSGLSPAAGRERTPQGSVSTRDPPGGGSSSRPITPFNDGPAPVLRPPPGRAGDPDASSVISAPGELMSGLSMAEPTAPGADSQESLMRRFRLTDTLIGRIPEVPETRASLVTRLAAVSLFIIQPLCLSHRFQEYSGEKLLVLDQAGNPLLFGVETDRSALRRACCFCWPAHRRPFTMTLYDLEQRPVAQFCRRLACVSCWSPCCLQRARLRDSIRAEEEQQTELPESEMFYGVIRQRWHLTRPEFVCSGIRGGVVLRVRGPPRGCCASSGDAVFHVLGMHGKARLGAVAARWQPLDVDVFRRSDNYGVQFDSALPSRAKITLLGAAMLLDFLFFNV